MLKKSIVFIFVIGLLSCNTSTAKQGAKTAAMEVKNGLQVATFGNGCFWCTEAVFQALKGVTDVTAGYAGGQVQAPSYELVSSGTTGHAEVIRLTYDPKVISYRELLEIFFYTHDPTTLNRQGADVGTQYRSVIFYHNEAQRKEAVAIIDQIGKEKVYPDPIVTEVTPIDNYFEAEEKHQDYYNNNKNDGYCRAVINPKLEKFIQKYRHKLR